MEHRYRHGGSDGASVLFRRDDGAGFQCWQGT